LSQIFREIESSALKLNEKQRAKLARRLITSLEHRSEQDAEKAWIEEVKRRKNEIEKNHVKSVSFDLVMDEARSLIST
jgi:putative addiction module component (TIGR02574 family)